MYGLYQTVHVSIACPYNFVRQPLLFWGKHLRHPCEVSIDKAVDRNFSARTISMDFLGPSSTGGRLTGSRMKDTMASGSEVSGGSNGREMEMLGGERMMRGDGKRQGCSILRNNSHHHDVLRRLPLKDE